MALPFSFPISASVSGEVFHALSWSVKLLQSKGALIERKYIVMAYIHRDIGHNCIDHNCTLSLTEQEYMLYMA